jgi:Fe-S-cluster-containing hydrogenase component 2
VRSKLSLPPLVARWGLPYNDKIAGEETISAHKLTAVETHGERYSRRLCMNCQQPACASVCPVGALQKTALGPVTYDADKCMGCRYCMQACPFLIPKYDYENLAPLGENVTAGQPVGAIHFLENPQRDPALVIWLDGQRNTRQAPNENLARELMELFTLGIGNYTETDVKQVALDYGLMSEFTSFIAALLIEVSGRTYAMPLSSVVESIKFDTHDYKAAVNLLAGGLHPLVIFPEGEIYRVAERAGRSTTGKFTLPTPLASEIWAAS